MNSIKFISEKIATQAQINTQYYGLAEYTQDRIILDSAAPVNITKAHKKP